MSTCSKKFLCLAYFAILTCSNLFTGNSTAVMCKTFFCTTDIWRFAITGDSDTLKKMVDLKLW